jgi:hypothetical protein
VPFNSRSYRRNKAERRAREYLAEARDAKARGDASRVRSRVELARLSWRGYLSYRRLDQMDADFWRYRKGEMTHAEFMAKWDLRK